MGQLPGVERNRMGVAAALAAFFLWGILPIFWKMLDFLPSPVIVAQRTLWSLALLVGVLAVRGEWGRTARALRAPTAAAWHLLSGALLASNWLLYVWATLHGHIIEAALGYYLNPFFNMLFGALWFGDRNSRWQMGAIGLAFAGVLIQVPAAGHFPWIALTLAVSFSLYAVVRKRAPLGALNGLAAETLLLSPLALGWLILAPHDSPGIFGGTPARALLVVGTGLATALPLLFFGHAARTLRLTTLGILQFLGPTLQFFIGWRLYHEPVTVARLLSFGLIWLAVAIYAADALRKPPSPSSD